MGFWLDFKRHFKPLFDFNEGIVINRQEGVGHAVIGVVENKLVVFCLGHGEVVVAGFPVLVGAGVAGKLVIGQWDGLDVSGLEDVDVVVG